MNHLSSNGQHSEICTCILFICLFTIFDLITAHTLISTQSNYLVVFKLQLVYFYFLLHKSICFWYSFELPQQVEAIQMSTNNIIKAYDVGTHLSSGLCFSNDFENPKRKVVLLGQIQYLFL